MGGDDATNLFQMAEEASTGTSGATGRQLVLDAATLGDGARDATLALLGQLEVADARGGVALRGEADAAGPESALPVAYVAERSAYRVGGAERARDALLADARSGALRVVLTAQLPPRFGAGVHRQPLLAVATRGAGPTGDPAIPLLASARSFQLQGIDVEAGARIHVDGAPTPGSVRCIGDEFAPYCATERIELRLDAPPREPGLHLVQVQNPGGPLSDELPVCVPPVAACR